MRCNNCGFEISQGETFCQNCGHLVESAQTCPRCGRRLDSNGVCSYCTQGKSRQQQGKTTQQGKAARQPLMKNCDKCGAEMESTALFCEVCGAKQGADDSSEFRGDPYGVGHGSYGGGYDPSPMVRCRSCGSAIPEGSVYCGICGASQYTDPHSGGASGGTVVRKSSKAPMIILISVLVVVVAVAAGLIIKFANNDDNDSTGGQNETNAGETNELAVSMPPQDTASGSVRGSQTDEPVTGRVVANETPTPIPTRAPKSNVTPTPYATRKPSGGVNSPQHTYIVVVDQVTWSTARAAAEAAGGHLVTFQDRAEFDTVIKLLSDSSYSKVKNVWIGACAPVGLTSASAASAYWNSANASWITGEPFDFQNWRSGEPSGYDEKMGVEERYVQIFRPAADGGVWSYNDAGDDLSEYKPGTVAYVIEFE